MRRTVPAALLAAAVCALSPASALQEPQRDQPRAGEICTEIEAYSMKTGKAERRKLEEEARHDAFTAMAEKLWVESFPDSAVPSSRSAFAALRARYEVNAKIEGGRYGAIGDKHARSIEYCLPIKLYERAQQSLRARRASVIDAMNLRFFNLEGQIAAGETEAATRQIATLRADVITESLQFSSYRSERQDREQAYRAWLLEWSEQLPAGPELLRELTDRAQRLMEQGQLGAADRYVNEALEIDRTDAAARELRYEIQERRTRQAEALVAAQELARDGRYEAAEWKLAEARDLGADDAGLLEETQKTIDGLRAADRVFNPPMRAQFFMTMGSLGVDSSRVEDRVQEDTGLDVSASTPMSLGAGGSFRVGRKAITNITASWGFSQATNFTVNGDPLSLFDVFQVTAGAGYATRRSADRSFSFQFTGGVAWERVDVDGNFADQVLDSADQGGYYLRFAAERKNLILFVQHGFGFEDEEGSLVGWSNKFQFGVGGVF
jgi:hypothetical protein